MYSMRSVISVGGQPAPFTTAMLVGPGALGRYYEALTQNMPLTGEVRSACHTFNEGLKACGIETRYPVEGDADLLTLRGSDSSPPKVRNVHRFVQWVSRTLPIAEYAVGWAHLSETVDEASYESAMKRQGTLSIPERPNADYEFQLKARSQDEKWNSLREKIAAKLDSTPADRNFYEALKIIEKALADGGGIEKPLDELMLLRVYGAVLATYSQMLRPPQGMFPTIRAGAIALFDIAARSRHKETRNLAKTTGLWAVGELIPIHGLQIASAAALFFDEQIR